MVVVFVDLKVYTGLVVAVIIFYIKFALVIFSYRCLLLINIFVSMLDMDNVVLNMA